MSNRSLVKKVNVKVDECEESQTFELEYYVLQRDAYIEGETYTTYGIEVLKKSHPTSGSLRVEYRKIFDIFCSETEAREAALTLARNTVTPVSVRDIIEQFIGTDEFECEEYEIMAV